VVEDISIFIKDENQIPLVIGELGINHQGSIEMARELIRGAAAAGVHAIKFQYRNLLKSYSSGSNEIGDEILKSEIERNFLKVESILTLTSEAQDLGLWVGISFFIVEDCEDFGNQINEFDFYKIPSVELTNSELITFLVSTNKPVLISTGAHWEYEIERAFDGIPGENWFPLHCVSNYPVAPHNSNLSYISHLRERWSRPVGYSSHESDWEYALLSLKYGPRIIERHLTLDKSLPGLDQSSSSDLSDFTKLMKMLKSTSQDFIMPSNGRIPNQGELLNRQNLGRSFYFTEAQSSGQLLHEKTLVYRAPQVGIDKSALKSIPSKMLLEDGFQDSPLLYSHFYPRTKLLPEEIEFANNFGLALPVRLHDFEQVQNEIPLDALELHLSYSEVDRLFEFKDVFKSKRLSLHLPDYINSLQLIDPISDHLEVSTRSREIINKAVDFVSHIQEKHGYEVLIVGSFPVRSQLSREMYFDQYSSIQSELKDLGITLTMQWLPPFAWYFGGSEHLEILNSVEDLDFINKYEIDLCMDISHLLLGSNFFKFDPQDFLQILRQRIRFFHISDATGIDGEGSHFDLTDVQKVELFTGVLDIKGRKTIEVWQGHFDHCNGFKRAIKDLYSMRLGDAYAKE
jgi:sialic acid synthase SpsE/sugar phosphate isomerase/epimerase